MHTEFVYTASATRKSAIVMTKTITEVTQEVLDGRLENGVARKKMLTMAGYDLATITTY